MVSVCKNPTQGKAHLKEEPRFKVSFWSCEHIRINLEFTAYKLVEIKL